MTFILTREKYYCIFCIKKSQNVLTRVGTWYSLVALLLFLFVMLYYIFGLCCELHLISHAFPGNCDDESAGNQLRLALLPFPTYFLLCGAAACVCLIQKPLGKFQLSQNDTFHSERNKNGLKVPINISRYLPREKRCNFPHLNIPISWFFFLF